MRLESFLKQWIAGVSLEYRRELRTWMQNSYIDPAPFWEDLFSYSFGEIEGVSETVLFEKYDFYGDCILRHLNKGRIALKTIDSEGVTKSWTYDEIHHYVEVQVSHWKEHYDLKVGNRVLLQLPYGIHFLVALMSALRLGLTISILPLKDRYMGEAQFQKMEEVLKPDLTIREGLWENSSKKILFLDLALEGPAFFSQDSHVYLSGDIVQVHFNPHLKEGGGEVAIESTRSYLIALRDGCIAFQLKPSCVWARPFFSMLREEPCSTLTALLRGSTLLHIEEEYLKAYPKALETEQISVLGVGFPLLELWLKTPGAPAAKLKLWYRSPLFGNDRSWRAFSELNNLTKVSMGQILMDKEKGGVVLLSQPKVADYFTYMHPSLGSPWKLFKIGSTKALATEGFGLFCVEPMMQVPPSLILAQVGDEWCISSTSVPMKDGYPYPAFLVEELIGQLSFVQNCLVLLERHPQHFMSKQVTLLVFVSPSEDPLVSQKMRDWKREIDAFIQQQLGEAFLFDQLFFFALYPKMQNGKIDRNAVGGQYQSGHLFYKQDHPVHRGLTLLKNAIHENIAEREKIL